MKKVLFITALCTLLGLTTTMGKEMYTVYDNGTLTFYYDNLKASRTETTYAMNTGTNAPEWSDKSKDVKTVVFDPSFVSAVPQTTCRWFNEMENLNSIIHLEYLNTRSVENMSYMFTNCKRLEILDLRYFVTSQSLLNMSNMFKGCSSLKTIFVSMGGWQPQSACNGSNMFSGCTSLVSGYGTKYNSNYVGFSYAHVDFVDSPGYLTAGEVEYAKIFNGTLTFDYDIKNQSPGTPYVLRGTENWLSRYTDVNEITSVVFDPSFANARPFSTKYWFNYLRKLTSISGIQYLNTSKVVNMRGMFSYCEKLRSVDLSHFNTENVIDMSSLFWYCDGLTSLDVTKFNTAKVTDMGCMFINCKNLTSLDVSKFNTANVADMSSMFKGCSNLTSLDVSHFNTANVTDMSSMFSECSSLTSLDLSNFNTAKVTSMSSMFSECSNLKTVYVGSDWSTESVQYSYSMFDECTKLVGGQGTVYNSSYTDKKYARIDGGNTEPGYFSELKNYDLWVAGTQVSTINRMDILGDGSFSYDAEKNVLTVKGDKTYKGNSIIENKIKGLTISAACDVTLNNQEFTALKSEVDLTVTGPGKLTLASTNDAALFLSKTATLTLKDANVDASGQWGVCGPFGNSYNAKLDIINSTVVSKSTESDGAVCDFRGGITLTGCQIAVPEGGRVDGARIVDANGTAAKEVTIVVGGYTRADVNRDGTVDSADIVAVIKEMPDGDKKADVNGDTVIDSADIVAVIKAMK